LLFFQPEKNSPPVSLRQRRNHHCQFRQSPLYYAMLFERIFGPRTPLASPVAYLSVGPQPLPLLMVRNPRARRYLLRLRPDGTARVTIPRGGSTAMARQFVERHATWLERELQRLQSQPRKSTVWQIGTEILLRGDTVRIETGFNGDNKKIEDPPSSGYGETSENDATREAKIVRFGGESVPVPDPAADLRPAIEGHLRQLAARELPPRVLELAGRHGLAVRRIMVRNQKSRWGSCSRRGTISLNWRLIQTPAFVSDYICLHELVHLRQMNHSPKFWREVERVCPDYRMARQWLKEHSGLLR
jgi:predicted metal-dependent hydrolase